MASVEIIVAELHIPEARSLKEKRRVVKGYVEKAHHRFRISAAETAHHDLHQRAELTFAIVLTSNTSLAEDLRRFLEQDSAAYITQWNHEVIDLF